MPQIKQLIFIGEFSTHIQWHIANLVKLGYQIESINDIRFLSLLNRTRRETALLVIDCTRNTDVLWTLKNAVFQFVCLAVVQDKESGFQKLFDFGINDCITETLSRYSLGNRIQQLSLFHALLHPIPLPGANDLLEHEIKTKITDKDIVTKACNWLRLDLSRQATLKEIADAAGTNRSYLARAFKNELSISVYEWLSQYRVSIAKSALLFSNKSIYEIATEIGFEHASNFATTFKKFTGLSPTDFRKTRCENNSK